MLTTHRTLSEPDTAHAPYFQDEDGLVTIHNADSKDLSFLPSDSVHLIVTSPPYNLGKDYGTARDDATYHQYLDWVAVWCRQLWRVLEPGGRLCLNIPIDVNLSFDAAFVNQGPLRWIARNSSKPGRSGEACTCSMSNHSARRSCNAIQLNPL